MQRLRFMYRQFLRAPLWIKITAPAALIVSIVYSSSMVGDEAGYRSGAKLAAAVFFCVCGIWLRSNRRLAYIFYAVAALSLYLAWDAMQRV